MLPLCISDSSVPPLRGSLFWFLVFSLPACVCYQIVQFVQLVGCLPGGILKQLSNATWLPLLVVACLISGEAGKYTEKKLNNSNLSFNNYGYPLGNIFRQNLLNLLDSDLNIFSFNYNNKVINISVIITLITVFKI